MLGTSLRLSRLVRDGVYAIAALDHGLSSGAVAGLTRTADVLAAVRAARAARMRAVVLNYGLLTGGPPAQLTEALGDLAVVVQLYGSPGVNRLGGVRRPLGTVEGAVAQGADAIALQLTPIGDGLDELDRCATLAERARGLGIPTLLMLNRTDWASPQVLLDMVRSACELPVDLLKVTPGPFLADLAGDALAGLPKPVLFGGGPLRPDLDGDLLAAARAGFAGVCLGRNIFQGDDPARVAAAVEKAFTP
jgi:fructose-bisphosphate aldolase/2-amino-3,7-dideoxy-D-threo-hept-6-ulosonate synthase